MKNYILSIWNVIDPIYYIFSRLKYVLDNEEHPTLFRVRLTRYKGAKVTLSDGTIIRKNDLLLKIHLHNVRIFNELLHINSDLKKGLFIYHTIKHALPSLAHYVMTHHRSDKIKAVIGITSLIRGADRLGFDIFPITNPVHLMYKKGTFTVIHALAPNKSKEKPAYLFMSKDFLLNKYSEGYNEMVLPVINK